MSFKLKNTGATFQRLMDKVFEKTDRKKLRSLYGRCFAKSSKEENHPKDMEETFKNLQEAGIKVKPNNCTFGMKEGNFLGYLNPKMESLPIPKK